MVYSCRCSGRPGEFFSLEEIANNDAAQIVKIVWTPALTKQVVLMDNFRRWYKKPIDVSSWFRTPEYNALVGGAKNSAHLPGAATDTPSINTKDENLVRAVIAAWDMNCSLAGVVGGVEIYVWGVHLDSYSHNFGHSTIRVVDHRGR